MTPFSPSCLLSCVSPVPLPGGPLAGTVLVHPGLHQPDLHGHALHPGESVPRHQRLPVIVTVLCAVLLADRSQCDCAVRSPVSGQESASVTVLCCAVRSPVSGQESASEVRAGQ